MWDEEEPRLLVCEAKLLPKSGKSKMNMSLPEPSPGTSSSRRASSSTMTMPAASDSDKDSKVSTEESRRVVQTPTFLNSEERTLL
jgi:hypothetical protein